jgi:chemotaxis protein methyltransferase CheR
MRWAGFRRVRRQVRRRLSRRLDALGLDDAAAYRRYLESHPAEWGVLDTLCRVTVSRFHRNRGVFRFIFEVVLPRLEAWAVARGQDRLRAWSVGCASGEEPYTLAIGWRQRAGRDQPTLPLLILATDADAHLLERAHRAVYPASSLRELPAAWRNEGFDATDGGLALRPAFREGVTFRCEDVREGMPTGPFDLILCRNLVFTYYEEALQRRLLARMVASLAPRGALVVGHHETLPADRGLLTPWGEKQGVWRRPSGTS